MKKLKANVTFKNSWIYIVIAAIGVGIDQLTKFIAQKFLTAPVFFIKNFAGFYLTYNEGAAWSSFAGQRALLSSISMVACLGIALYFVFGKNSKLNKIALTLLFAGALGNAIDRIFVGKVVDFLYCNIFIMFKSEFPIFNVADLFVTAGAVLLIISLIFFDEDAKKKKEKKSQEETVTNE